MAHELDSVISRARSLERAGSVDDAAELVAKLIATSIDEGTLRPWLLRWRARLDVARGRVVEAVRLLALVRQRFGGTEAFLAHVDMGIACVRARDIPSAMRFAAEIDGGAIDLDPDPGAVPARLMRARSAGEGAPQQVALLRLYAAIWTAGGHYDAAAAATEAALAEAETAPDRFRVGRIALDLADLHLAAGELARAASMDGRAPASLPADEAASWSRHRLRRALAGGQLAAARTQAELLRGAPPARSAREQCRRVLAIAELEASLNRFAVADSLAASLLAGDGMQLDDMLRGSVERFRELVQVRSQSALEDFELPFLPEQVFDIEDPFGDEEPPADDPAGAAPSTVAASPYAAWARAADSLLRALECGDDAAALLAAERLEATPCQSRYIELRTRFYRALVARAEAALFGAIALELESGGFLLAALQVHRHAGWRAIRGGDATGHLRHVRRAHELVDAVTLGLGPEDRIYFMLNQWSAEDEYISARSLAVMRVLSGASRRAARRALVELYRPIAMIDTWHLERSLGAEPAADRSVHVATHEIEDIVSRQLALLGPSRATRFQLRSGWSLWRVPRDTTVLHFRVLADRMLVFVLGFRQIALHVVPVTRAILHDAIRTLLLVLQDEGTQGTNRLREISELLGVPALLREARGRRLVVIPHDAIVNVPFAALPIDAGGTRLCERHTITCLPGLEYLARRRRKVPGGNLLGVAVTDYGGRQTDLPGAREELGRVSAAIRRHGWTHTSLEDHDATPARVLAELPSHTWAHFACHGVFDRDHPHHSGLLVAGSEKVTVEQIMQLRLASMHVAVLAACWSAEATALPGLERISVPGALLRAGVDAVIGSLWEVDDAATRRLFETFYARAPVVGCETALAEIQRDAHRRRSGAEREWANFVMYGTS